MVPLPSVSYGSGNCGHRCRELSWIYHEYLVVMLPALGHVPSALTFSLVPIWQLRACLRGVLDTLWVPCGYVPRKGLSKQCPV
mmetsp:Transcript_54603/g.156997  ORF Transcript_54603/g.156997 Transcript_54603/m.156997 type:complete len:83 (+) Transcript_54603:1493-1741(+)